MTLRPLPRSLDPLEDETLVGFILRLARHNGTTPEQVAARLGLMDGPGETPGVVSPWLLADMDKPRLARAARAAHLTVAEADKLLLAPMGHRYGLVSRRYRPWTSPRQLDRPNRWILVRTSQYCPSCLAGDGSPQGALNGGAWRRSWRLPVVFACVRHRQLLHRVCPACRTPGQFARAGLIARPGMEELHPAQCRSPSAPGSVGVRLSVCGADLSRVGPARIPEDADSLKALLALQGRLDELLATNGPPSVGSCGRLVPVAQYFIDLRVVATLILASWPEASRFAATPTLAQAIEREAVQRMRDSRRRTRRGGSKSPYGINSLLSPMESALTMGAVLGIAVSVLEARDKNWTERVLRPFYDAALALNRDTFRRLARLPGTSLALQQVLGVAKETADTLSPEIYVRGPRNG